MTAFSKGSDDSPYTAAAEAALSKAGAEGVRPRQGGSSELGGQKVKRALKRSSASKELLADLQAASVSGQHSRQPASNAQHHVTHRSAGPVRYQQVAETMRRESSQRDQRSQGPAPSPSRYAFTPAHKPSQSAPHGKRQTYQPQQPGYRTVSLYHQTAQGRQNFHSAGIAHGKALAGTANGVPDLYTQLCMQAHASQFHRLAFAASLSDTFQRDLGSSRPIADHRTAAASAGQQRGQYAQGSLTELMHGSYQLSSDSQAQQGAASQRLAMRHGHSTGAAAASTVFPEMVQVANSGRSSGAALEADSAVCTEGAVVSPKSQCSAAHVSGWISI